MAIGDEFNSRDWPLHCTIAGVFALDLIDTLLDEFATVTASHEAFQTATTDIDYFGPNESVKVRLLAMTEKLNNLHNDVVTFIEQNNGVFNEPHFLRQDFAPHITMRGEAPDKNGAIVFSQLTLVDMFPDADHTRRRVIASFPLSTTQEQ